MSVVTGPRSRTDRRRPASRRRGHSPRTAAGATESASHRTEATDGPTGIAGGRFALVVTLLLGLGLVGALTINTSLAGGAIALTEAEAELARATERLEALEVATDAVSSPGALQAQAIALGMVPAASPVFLDPATGAISGTLTPALTPEVPLVQGSQIAEPDPDESASAVTGLTGTASVGPQSSVDGESPAADQSQSDATTGLDGATVVQPEASDD